MWWIINMLKVRTLWMSFALYFRIFLRFRHWIAFLWTKNVSVYDNKNFCSIFSILILLFWHSSIPKVFYIVIHVKLIIFSLCWRPNITIIFFSGTMTRSLSETISLLKRQKLLENRPKLQQGNGFENMRFDLYFNQVYSITKYKTKTFWITNYYLKK